MNFESLRCPVCGGPLRRVDRSYSCPARHCFDIAKQGYVNLLPVTQKHSKHPGDTRDMVAARRAFLDQGYYAPIAEKTSSLLRPHLPDRPSVLDVGCGEGYYLSRLQEDFVDGCFLGVDISKEAVRFAAGRNKSALWLTASAAHLPIGDASLDGVMSMFALSMPGEFHRVLKPGGCYLEVIAGRGHLMGLKNLIYSEIIEKQEKTLPDYPGFRLLVQETLEFPIHLTKNEEIMQLLTMTPHFWRIRKDGAARAAESASLDDFAQVEFRLYQKIATPSIL